METMNISYLLFMILLFTYKLIAHIIIQITFLTPIVQFNSYKFFCHRIDHLEYMDTFFIYAIQFHIYIRLKIILQIKFQ